MKNDINVKLLRYYMSSKCVEIEYLDKSVLKNIVGVVNEINYVKRTVTLFPRLEIPINDIVCILEIQ